MANKEHIKWFLEGVESWNKRRQKEPFEPDFERANIPFELGSHMNSFEEVNLSDGRFRQANFSGLNLKGANLKNARFEGAILKDVDLSGAELGGANFNHAILSKAKLGNVKALKTRFNSADLSGADLQDAELEGAILKDVDLSGAELGGANFNHAILSKAKLGNVKALKTRFNSADLSGADLQDAELEGADLLAAKLIQANFTNTKPWNSHLYLFPEDQNQEKHIPNFTKEIKNVTGLVDICKELKNHYEDDSTKNFFGNDWQFYYRGQCESSWKLFPSVMRPSENETYPFRIKEGEMLLDLMSRRPEDFIGVSSALSQWVIAQHYGLKTRLLDITRNPLVALFHACDNVPDQVEGRLYVFAVPKLLIKPFDSDAISIVANLAKLPRYEQDLLLMGTELDIEEFYRRHYLLYEDIEDSCYRYIMGRLYHCIGQEKPYFKERIDIRDLLRVFVVEPQQSFERIRAQSGAFLISALHERFERDKILDFNPCIPIYDFYDEIIVPRGSKEDILEELRLMNITREVLFPSLQEVAKATVEQYKETQESGETSS